MCKKEWGGQNICYPTTRVNIENNDWSQGTFLNGRFFDNRCDKCGSRKRSPAGFL